MRWNRSLRLPATIWLTLSLALGALAAPALVSAKPAPLQFGVGTGFDTTKTTGAMPQTVSPGATVAFEVWARNSGGSNISKLFLTARTAAAFDSVTVINTGNTSGSCAPATGGIALKCSWKPLKPGAAVRVRLVLTAPASGAALPVNFEWSSSGFVTGGNNSHGDLFTKNDSVSLNGDADSFTGRYIKKDGNKVVETNQDLGEGNPQSTKVTAPEDEIGASVGEDDDISDCQELFGEDCFGQAVVLHINDGQSYPGGFTAELVYVGEFPYADFVHFFDDGSFEDLDECGEEPEAPCFQLDVTEGFTHVTLFLTENGKTFGH